MFRGFQSGSAVVSNMINTDFELFYEVSLDEDAKVIKFRFVKVYVIEILYLI